MRLYHRGATFISAYYELKKQTTSRIGKRAWPKHIKIGVVAHRDISIFHSGLIGGSVSQTLLQECRRDRIDGTKAVPYRNR